MIRARSPAKINLTLDITGRRDDGFHLVHTIMQSIDLYEMVEICKNEHPELELSISGADIPINENNTASRAVKAFFDKTGIDRFGLKIHIDKKIPVGAGLAGGSADAAAVLVALNELSGIRLTRSNLCEIGSIVGSDVPFCILGGTAVGTGIGTTLSPLPSIPHCCIVVAKPYDWVSTAEAYSRIDIVNNLPKSTANNMITAIKSEDLIGIAKNLSNAFDSITNMPGVQDIKRTMAAEGALGCQMTGSGSAVFGIFRSEFNADHCIRKLKLKYSDVFLCSPENQGACIF